MSVIQVSALCGQWIGIVVWAIAIFICVRGINIEKKYRAEKGFLYITIGGLLLGVGSLIFTIATKMLGF